MYDAKGKIIYLDVKRQSTAYVVCKITEGELEKSNGVIDNGNTVKS